MRNKIEYAGRVFSDEVGAAYHLTSGDCLLSLAAMSDSLAADALEFDVKSSDTTLINYSPNAQMAYLYRDERVGTFYVQSVARTGVDTYHFTAASAMGLLMGKTHYGGMYTGQTVEEAVADIVAGTGVTVSIKTVFRAYKLYGWLPVATARDNLSQVLFAIGAALKTNADGVLRVTSLFAEPSWARDSGKCFIDGSVGYGTPVSRVIVTEHKWETGTETVELFAGAAGQGDIIRFDEPMHSLSASGFAILESNCNYARLSQGTGTLTGTKYVHNMRDIVRTVSETEGNDVTVKEAYLVSLMNSVGVAERLAGYYANVETITQRAIWAGEHAGDVVRTAHPYGGYVDVMLTNVDISMSGVLAADEEGVVGYKPQPPESQEYYDHEEVLTGSGEWTSPIDGTITVVLIGGGDGGASGNAGEKGGTGQRSTYTDFWDKQVVITPGPGGNGGAGGNGGSGGKLLQVSIEVAKGQKFQFASGLGGTSESNGSATTFGEYTSDNGAPSDSGYTDPVSGVKYAAKGTNGKSGGKGSGVGDDGSSIVAGDTVDGYTPGERGTTVSASDNGYYRGNSIEATTIGATSLGGLGGGAAVGANGNAGGSGTAAATSSDNTDTTNKAFTGSLTLVPGPGGRGATPPAPAAKALLGAGGDGGHGGGGGGGTGGGQYMHDRNTTQWPGITFNVTENVGNGFPGVGGDGGPGGSGGPGGILVYYSIPKVVKSGRFLANGKPFFARGRRTLAV